MRGHFLALFASLAFWALCAFTVSVIQGSAVGARVMALILLPCAVVAILTARKASGR